MYKEIEKKDLIKAINECKRLKDIQEEKKMTDFNEMKLKEVIKIDVENVAKELLIPNKEKIYYDKDCSAWFIGGEEIVDELYYDCYTILHPKEIIGYIDEYIEEVMKIKKEDENEN